MSAKKNSGEKKKTVNIRKKKIDSGEKKKIDSGEKKKTVNTRKKKVSSEKKVSSPKKTTKSSIISCAKIIIKMLSFLLITAFEANAFINVSNDFKSFIKILLVALPVSIVYNVNIKTPTKIDSKKNVIKLPLSKFKFIIKKILSVINPMIFYLGSTITLITAIIFIKTFINIANTSPTFKKEDINEIYKTIIDTFTKDLTVKTALENMSIPYINDNSIVSIIKNYYPSDKINEILNSASNVANNTIKYFRSFTSNLEFPTKMTSVPASIMPPPT